MISHTIFFEENHFAKKHFMDQSIFCVSISTYTHKYHNSRSYRSGQECRVVEKCYNLEKYSTMKLSLLYAIYDPLACGSNLITLTEEKPENVSILPESNHWIYWITEEKKEKYTIGQGLRDPGSDLSGIMMVISKDDKYHFEELEKNMKEMGLFLM